MSLSSFLLKSSGAVDSELDALFKSQPAKLIPITSIAPSEPESPSKKRKLVEEKIDAQPKRRKSDSNNGTRKPKPKAKAPVPSPPPEEDEDENSDLEAAYLRFKEENAPVEDGSDEAEEVEEEDEADAPNLVHESLTGKAKSKSKTKTKKERYVPADETPAQRDQRTVFIGNLSLEVAQKRPLQKQLQRHILSFVPEAKIESIRFRSVPFSSPSANQSSTTEEDQSHKNPSQREHNRTRASSWRTSTSTETETKSYLSPNQKKKYLFLTSQFHTSGTTVHSYIVFAHPMPVSTTPRPSNLPPLPDILDPYEAAKQAVKNADGTEFEGRVIRVDFVGKVNAKGKAKEDGEDGGEMVDGNKAFEDADTKCTLFVGNLDLSAQEGDLRTFFDTLMKSERGEPSSTTTEAAVEGTNKSKSWVTHVRIIRDKDTQLGKGFGYVQFIDRECIDEILTLEPTQLKFAKRKLRVQRCKTLPGGTTKLSSSLKSSLKTSSSAQTKSSSTSTAAKPQKSSRAPPTPIQVPKGDPNLGAKLSTMSKEERKAVKAADADRIARRLAKKKARMALGTARDRAAGGEGGGEKKVRERVRKTVGVERKGKGAMKEAKDGKKKRRVRSERSLEKRNAKK